MYLLEEAHVATVDGAAFCAPGYIRLSYATSDDNIREAARRIAAASILPDAVIYVSAFNPRFLSVRPDDDGDLYDLTVGGWCALVRRKSMNSGLSFMELVITSRREDLTPCWATES